MALVKCSECGRTISDKAKLCIGCGAPLERNSEVKATPERETGPAPSRNQALARAALSAVVFGLGVVWSSALRQSGTGPASIAAALLIVVGLCGVIVSAVQWYTSRK